MPQSKDRYNRWRLGKGHRVTMLATLERVAMLDAFGVDGELVRKRGEAEAVRVMLCELTLDCRPLILAIADGIEIAKGDTLIVPRPNGRMRRLPVVRPLGIKRGLRWLLAGVPGGNKMKPRGAKDEPAEDEGEAVE